VAVFFLYSRQHPEYREHVLPAAVTARLGGTSIDAWLGAVCREHRPHHWHGDLWGVGAAQGIAAQIRLYPRVHRGGSQSADSLREVNDAERPKPRAVRRRPWIGISNAILPPRRW
jgi:hypothetical protein